MLDINLDICNKWLLWLKFLAFTWLLSFKSNLPSFLFAYLAFKHSIRIVHPLYVLRFSYHAAQDYAGSDSPLSTQHLTVKYSIFQTLLIIYALMAFCKDLHPVG